MPDETLLLGAYRNWLAEAGSTLEALHADPLTPASNLLTDDLSMLWGSGSQLIHAFGIDLGAPREVSSLYLPGHDGNTGIGGPAIWRLQGDDVPIPLANPSQVTTPYDSGPRSLEVDPLTPYLRAAGIRRRQAALHLLGQQGRLAPATHRYWMLSVDNISAAGGLFIGPSMSLRLQENFSITGRDFSLRRRLAGGDLQVHLRRNLTQASLPVIATAGEGPRDLLTLLRGDARMGVSIFPGTSEAPALSFWAAITGSERTLQHQTGQITGSGDGRYSYYKLTLEVEEV